MIFVWGTKIKRKKLGWVADFCPICRDFGVFKLIRVGRASHLYYISIGSGKLVGHEVQCAHCGTVIPAAEEKYVTVSKRLGDDVDALVEATHPEMYERYAKRLEAEERLQSGQLTDEERAHLLAEPFVLVNDRIAERAASMHIDIYTALTFAMALFVLGLLALWGESLGGRAGELASMALVPGLVALFLLPIILIATDVRRFVRRKIHPVLVRALLPLKPTCEELTETLRGLRQAGLQVGAKVKAEKLYNDLKRSHAESLYLH